LKFHESDTQLVNDMKQELWVSILICILLPSFILAGAGQSFESPDTKIRGTVTDIQYNYEGSFFSGTYKITARIVVRLNETLIKPETFTREIDESVAVSYNYSAPPNCNVGQVVEVYGLWISRLDVPGSGSIRVDEQVIGSYVEVLAKPLSPAPLSGDLGQGAGEIDTEREYSNGSIRNYYQDGRLVMGLWYDWVYTQGTQVLFLAYCSEAFNSPIITFVGQRYATADGTEVFMGNTLSLMEAYEDINSNYVPDISETSYSFLVNSSVSFTVTPIQRIEIENIAHFGWGVKYQTIDGFLQDQNGTSVAKVIVDHMTFSYDYYIEKNVSYMKTDFDIGKISNVEACQPDFTLRGLSLSLLYTTLTITPRNYTVFVNEQPYNSTTSLQPIYTNRTEVKIENQKSYEFLFGQNYTLFSDTSVESHKSFSTAETTSTIESNARVSLTWLLDDLEEALKEIFPKISTMQVNINLDYASSTFVYRVCYPVWNGCRIMHDPTYIAYINPQGLLRGPSSPPLQLLVAALAIGLITMIAAIYELQKTRRLVKSFSPNLIR